MRKSRAGNWVLPVAALTFPVPSPSLVELHPGQTNRHLLAQFSRASCRLYVLTSSFDWFTRFSVCDWAERFLSFWFYNTQLKGEWTVGQGDASLLAQAFTLP